MGQWGKRTGSRTMPPRDAADHGSGPADRSRPQSGIPVRPRSYYHIGRRLEQEYLSALEDLYRFALPMQEQLQDLRDAGGAWPQLQPLLDQVEKFSHANTDIAALRDELQAFEAMKDIKPREVEALSRELTQDMIGAITHLQETLQTFHADSARFAAARDETVALHQVSSDARPHYRAFFESLDAAFDTLSRNIDTVVTHLEATVEIATRESEEVEANRRGRPTEQAPGPANSR